MTAHNSRCTLRLRQLDIVILGAAVLFPLTSAEAATVVVEATDSGWYSSPTGSIPGSLNYLVGSTAGAIFRNFFVFDLSGNSEQILSARLAGFNRSGNFHSPQGKETWEVNDVVTPLSQLLDGTGGVAAYNDLGTGRSS
jgi:hypothetical protein